jgi:hypothetical protein
LIGKAKEYGAMKADECAQCDIAILRKFYPHTQRGYDKYNRPLLFERNGKTEVNPIFLLTTKETLFAYHFWTMEQALDRMFTESAIKFYGATPGEKVVPTSPVNISTCAILDFNDFGLSHCSSKMLDLVKSFVAIDNTVYPEMLGKMLVINAPWLAVQTWSIVRGWLDPRTQAKIEIVGPGSESLKRLHELIPKEYLPAEFSGTAPDLYYLKPHTEYLQLPRGGEVTRTIDVPIGKVLFVDTYLGEGAVEVTVSTITPATISPQSPICVSDKKGVVGSSTPVAASSSFFSRGYNSMRANPMVGSPTRELHTTSTVLEVYEMKINAETNTSRGSERCLKHYCGPDATLTAGFVTHTLYKITWKNPSKDFFGGVKNTFVYSLTIADSTEFPDMLSVINAHTSLDSSHHRHSHGHGHAHGSAAAAIASEDARYRSATIAGSAGSNETASPIRDRSPSTPSAIVKSTSYPEVSMSSSTPIHRVASDGDAPIEISIEEDSSS